MATSLSRRRIAGYIADQIITEGQSLRLVRQLAAYLIDSRRTKELELVVRDIEYELQERGTVLAQVTSASKLTEDTRKLIEGFIKSETNAKKILLRQFIDPEVLGGAKIDLPGRQLDATIMRRLTTLRTNYKK
jgi:F-type H+-transporting ATPase subunit delta